MSPARSVVLMTLLLASSGYSYPEPLLEPDESRARQAGEAAVKTVIPRKFDYRSLKLGFMPFRATVSKISISENDAFARHPLRDWSAFATADRVDITAELLPLFIGRIAVTDLNVTNFHANVLVDKDFRLNVGDLMQQKRGPLVNWLRVKQCLATGGSVRVVDATAVRGPANLVFDDITARFTGFAVKDKFDLDIGLRTPGATSRNVSLRGIAGPIYKTVRSEQVPITGMLTVDRAPILPFSPYIPAGLTAYPESGEASMNLQLQGNAWEGLVTKGGIRLDRLVMTSPDGKLKGKPFTMALDIGHNVLTLKENRLDINAMAVSMGGNRLTVDGKVTGLPRRPVIDVAMRAPAMDPSAMEEVYPFFRAYLPKGLQFNGTTALDIQTRGNMESMVSTGRLDVSRIGLFLDNVFAKKTGASLAVDFSASLAPSRFAIQARATVKGDELQLLNAWVFRDGLRLALGKTVPAKAVDAAVSPMAALVTTAVHGVMDYENGFVRFTDFAADGLRDKDSVVADALFTGSFDLNRRIVRWDVRARLSPERTRGLLKMSPGLASRLDAEGRLPFRFRVEGDMEKPEVIAAP